MAHGLSSVIKHHHHCGGGSGGSGTKAEGKSGVGSRRIFSPHFKLQVLDSYRNDADCKGNQRATARKYGIHRRQIQKWLQAEATLRCGVNVKQQQQQHHHQSLSSPSTSSSSSSSTSAKSELALNGHRQRDDESASLAGEARVPVWEPPPDGNWRLHQQQQQATAAPIDLSIKRAAASSSPAPLVTSTKTVLDAYRQSSTVPVQHPDVWDLSYQKERMTAYLNGDTKKAPVKLFKPYLDVTDDDSNKGCQSPDEYPHNNNNNSVYCCGYAVPGGGLGYTLHELQPSQTSPYYAPYGVYYPYPSLSPTYSLDYKVSAIEGAYCQDTLCKGNPRAVVMKYYSMLRKSTTPLSDDSARVVR